MLAQWEEWIVVTARVLIFVFLVGCLYMVFKENKKQK